MYIDMDIDIYIGIFIIQNTYKEPLEIKNKKANTPIEKRRKEKAIL